MPESVSATSCSLEVRLRNCSLTRIEMTLEAKESSGYSKSAPSGPVPESRGAVDDEKSVIARVAPLTGRDTEVNLLKDRWEQANEGMGQVVLLIGEAGLGKSRLVHTLKEHVLGQMV